MLERDGDGCNAMTVSVDCNLWYSCVDYQPRFSVPLASRVIVPNDRVAVLVLER